MNVDKDQIIDVQRSQGEQDEVATDRSETPDEVSTDDVIHEEPLSKSRVDPSEITGNVGGFGTIL